MNKPLDTVLPNPPQSQTSFRKSHSAMDNIDRIETDMTDALHECEGDIAVLFDWTDAYVNVKSKKLQDIMYKKISTSGYLNYKGFIM